jgi:hypothetical protein
VLDVDDFLGYVRDPWRHERAVFGAAAAIDRADCGLTDTIAPDTGCLLVSTCGQIELELELSRQ